MTEIAPRKTVVEIQVSPKLSFYEKMDKAGQALLGSMKTSHWERNPNSLDILDLEHREKVGLQYRRYVAEMDGPIGRQRDSVCRGFSLLSEAATEIASTEILRIGVRQWFALELRGNDEKRLIERLIRTYSSVSSLAATLKMTAKDWALVLEMQSETDPNHSARLGLGAMSKDQWTRHTPYNAGVKGYPNHLGKQGLPDIISELPDDFIFIDIDKRKHAAEGQIFNLSQCRAFVDTVAADMKDICRQIIQDIRESDQ